MVKRLLVKDTRTVELADHAAVYFVAEKIAVPVNAPDRELDLSTAKPWSSRPVVKLLLFLGGHDVSND